MAQLYFKYGAMGSSKTANALMTRFNYEERGQKTLLVKPRLDTRDGDHMVVSRIGLTYPCIYFDEMQQLSVMELQQNACVIVDEAQFLTREEVMYLVGLVDDLGIPVICRLCPRNCGEERTETRRGGVCGMPSVPVAARAMLHLWEEPCLVGERGAGCVFFSGCNLRCCFCQNKPISQGEVGKVLTAERLREIFHELIGQEAACLDLVTPTHFTDAVLEALGDEEWPVPVVWNCGGYEKPETLRRLEGKVQVYLPDLKYGLSEPARKYSGAADYFDWAKRAILEMFRQTGPYRMENGLLKQGVLIRHLLLPGELENTRRVIDWVAESFRPGEVLFSLMSQYTPQPGAEGKLARHVIKVEYRAAVEYMENCGITDGYTQERTSAREEYTPAFDLRGI